jgi:acetylornithine deacetylase/succinyl-diaminopimelate desuccinylase-like protein
MILALFSLLVARRISIIRSSGTLYTGSIREFRQEHINKPNCQQVVITFSADAVSDRELLMNRERTIERLFHMVDEAAEELVALHQALVQIPTVNTGAAESGNETGACRLLAERFAAEGIAYDLVESAPGRGNLVARWGEGSGPSLMLMSHVDVVPVEDESKWRFPPFSGKIVDGKVFGRGSDDAKSLAASGAMTLLLLKRAGMAIRGETRFLAAADEEAGGRYGIQWLARERPELVHTDYAVNEGGGLHLDTAAGLAYLICIGEKGRLEAHFTVRGRSGHAAGPWRADNALYKLAQLLERIRAYQPEIDLRIPTFAHLDLFGIQRPLTPETLDQELAILQEQNPALANLLRGVSRMSIAPTMAQAGIKSNSIPATASLVCDIRCLPHQSVDYVRAQLEQIAAGVDGVEVRVEVTAVSNASDYHSPFVNNLQRATELALGRDDLKWLPGVTTGFTDSRAIRPLGTQVFGFSPLLPESETMRPGVHGVDEAFEIDNLIFRTKLNVALAYLTTGETE